MVAKAVEHGATVHNGDPIIWLNTEKIEQSIKVDGDRASTAACSNEAQEPMDDSREPVLEPRQNSNMHDEPHDPTGELDPVQADDRISAVHGGHAPEVPVLPRRRVLGLSDAVSDDVSSMDSGLKRDLGDAREVVVVHHVADDEYLRMAEQ